MVDKIHVLQVYGLWFHMVFTTYKAQQNSVFSPITLVVFVSLSETDVTSWRFRFRGDGGWFHQASLYYQPKQGIITWEIPQNYHTFVLFDSPKMGNLMTSDVFTRSEFNISIISPSKLEISIPWKSTTI